MNSNSNSNSNQLLASLKLLDDARLILQTENFVREERELLTTVLHHLREIERRRLFSALGYKSLFDFAVKHLSYSEDQAYRRISAMKLLKEIPELETKISSGELTLSHIGLAQAHFRQEKKIHQSEVPRDQKISLLKELANKPFREAQQITLALSSAPEMAKPDRVTALTENLIEMKFSASTQLPQKVEQLKGWLAHKYPNLTLGELFEKLCDLGLEEWNPAKVATFRNRRVKSAESIQLGAAQLGSALNEDAVPLSQNSNPKKKSTAVKNLAPAKKRHDLKQSAPSARISLVVNEPSLSPNKMNHTSTSHAPLSKAQIRRDVFARANNKCENCGSSYFLEVDHIQPRAQGGNYQQKNLRLLCRSCNQRAAIEKLGMQRMDNFINFTLAHRLPSAARGSKLSAIQIHSVK